MVRGLDRLHDILGSNLVANNIIGKKKKEDILYETDLNRKGLCISQTPLRPRPRIFSFGVQLMVPLACKENSFSWDSLHLCISSLLPAERRVYTYAQRDCEWSKSL